MLLSEKNRLPMSPEPVAGRIAAHISWLEKELERTDRELDEAVHDSEVWRRNERLLIPFRFVDGIIGICQRYTTQR
jgi:transposase